MGSTARCVPPRTGIERQRRYPARTDEYSGEAAGGPSYADRTNTSEIYCAQSIVFLPCPSVFHEVPSMIRRLPPLNALKAFEAAARHESFTRAAEELCVTQGAVSHQVKALEAELAVKLFNRERQRLIITEAGRDYLNVVRDALDRIAAGTERLVQRQSAGVLTVSTSPDFAAKWLVHRLGHFAEAHSDIDLRVSAKIGRASCRERV